MCNTLAGAGSCLALGANARTLRPCTPAEPGCDFRSLKPASIIRADYEQAQASLPSGQRRDGPDVQARSTQQALRSCRQHVLLPRARRGCEGAGRAGEVPQVRARSSARYVLHRRWPSSRPSQKPAGGRRGRGFAFGARQRPRRGRRSLAGACVPALAQLTNHERPASAPRGEPAGPAPAAPPRPALRGRHRGPCHQGRATPSPPSSCR